MDYSNRYRIPQEILYSNECNVNILVGENGCGKSTLLNVIRRYYISNYADRHVIAIANTIYDKFDKNKSNKHKILRAAQGKSLIKNTIFNAFKILARDNNKRLYNIAKILEYINFRPEIGLKIKGIDEGFREKLIESSMSNEDKENILFFLNRFNEHDILSNIVRIDLFKNSFDDIVNSSLIQIFLYERKLKELKLIDNVELFLFKDNYTIPITQASSGELSIIASLIYVATVITPNSIILIDEPENSLHPKWQTEYIGRLMDIFHYYQPKIIVATHSLLIIDGTENIEDRVNVFKGINGYFILQNINKTRNAEEIYLKYFDIITPENRYISDFVIHYMNLLGTKQIELKQFTKMVNSLIEDSYDDTQKEALRGIINLGNKIANENNQK